jgi:hypothetical protein
MNLNLVRVVVGVVAGSICLDPGAYGSTVAFTEILPTVTCPTLTAAQGTCTNSAGAFVTSSTSVLANSTTGATMAGIQVTARFGDGFSQTLTWAGTGSTAGGASNASGIHQWSLTNAGDSFTTPFVLTNSASSTFNITDIIVSGIGAINANGQGTIFDRTSIPNTSGTANEQTPGSHSGHDLSISSGTLDTYSVRVTYSDVFRVTSANVCTNSGTGSANQRTTAPCADGWATLTIHFNSGAGIGNFTPNSTLSFFQDGDNTIGPLVPGDYNGNGSVDAADYVVWRDNLGTSNTLPNDPTPGMVTQADYDFWKSNFGKTAGSAAGAASTVPEPTSLVLAVPLIAIRARRNQEKKRGRESFC